MDTRARPLTAFVSSTIDEFRDLRSAIKAWLEELGFGVMMSEFTDFGREPQQDTFDSCFQCIDRCDYFLLLIGSDKGSDFGDDSSVTREEFRHALDRAREGRIKLIVFVRDEVMTALYERRALKRMLEEGEVLTPETFGHVAHAIDQAPSRTLRDAEFIRSFVDEVRTAEVGVAPSGIAGRLWTYRFKGFGDIVAAMQATMPVRRSLRRQALLANLDWELAELLSLFLTRDSRGIPVPHTAWLTRVRTETDLGEIDLEAIWLAPEQVSRTSVFLFVAGSPTDNTPLSALQEAILSGELLEFNQAQGRLVPTPALTAMYQLSAEIKRTSVLRAALDAPLWAQSVGAMVQAAQMRQGAAVPVMVLGNIFAFHDALVNVLRLAVRLHRYVKTGEYAAPDLNPVSPFTGMPEGIEAETVTHAQVDGWLEFMLPRRYITGLPEPDLEAMTAQGREDLDRMQERFPEWQALLEGWNEPVREMIRDLMGSPPYRRLQESDDALAARRWIIAEVQRRIRQQSAGKESAQD